MSSEIQRRFDALQEKRRAVSIINGRFEGRLGSLVERDGSMCVVELDDDDGQVRVRAAHVYGILI